MIINKNLKLPLKRRLPPCFSGVIIKKDLYKVSISMISHVIISFLFLYVINSIYFCVIEYHKSNPIYYSHYYFTLFNCLNLIFFRYIDSSDIILNAK